MEASIPRRGLPNTGETKLAYRKDQMNKRKETWEDKAIWLVH